MLLEGLEMKTFQDWIFVYLFRFSLNRLFGRPPYAMDHCTISLAGWTKVPSEISKNKLGADETATFCIKYHICNVAVLSDPILNRRKVK